MNNPKVTLSNMPNIGLALAQKLSQAGISTPAHLIEAGTENAFIRLRTIDETACINMLYALEGAIQGIRWHNLSKSRKEELRDFFNSIS